MEDIVYQAIPIPLRGYLDIISVVVSIIRLYNPGVFETKRLAKGICYDSTRILWTFTGTLPGRRYSV
ncbi:MAG TPA: hypothetical protein VGD98_24095 [Ktedonobacteraceae bacterium]